MTASESTFYVLVALLLCLLVSTKSDDVQWPLSLPHNFHRSLREKCPNAEFFSGLYFPAFGLNTKIDWANLHFQSEYRKIRTKKNSVLGYFSSMNIKFVQLK